MTTSRGARGASYDGARAPVAQWIERGRPKAGVGGSNPSGGARSKLSEAAKNDRAAGTGWISYRPSSVGLIRSTSMPMSSRSCTGPAVLNGDAQNSTIAAIASNVTIVGLEQQRELRMTRADARLAVFDYIEAFYNPIRRHAAFGYLSPVEFERRYRTEPITAA